MTLVVANAISQGTRNGLATVAGAGSGNALLIIAAIFDSSYALPGEDVTGPAVGDRARG